MAKQNVSFFERHMEKIIAGVCAAVLMAAFVVYTLDTPHGVKVGEQTLGPSDFYGKFKSEVESAREKLLRARSVELTKPTLPADMNQEQHALLVAKLPPRLPSAFVFPSPDVPQLVGGPPPGAIDLAKILPPVRPVLTTGRSTAALPAPVVVSFDTDTARLSLSEMKDAGAPQDTFWVTVVSALNRKLQRDVFEAAKYNATRMALIVGAVDVERQELLPGGGWSPAAAVQPYMPWSIKPVSALKMEEQDGILNIPQDQAGMLAKYREKIEDYNTQQQEILRPHFVNFLKSHAWDWKVPHRLEGMSVDMTTFGVQFPPEAPKRRPDRPTPQRPNEPVGAGGRRPGDKPGPGAQPPKPVKPPTGEAAGGPVKNTDTAGVRKAAELRREADDKLKARDKATDQGVKDNLLLEARAKLEEIVKLGGSKPEELDDKQLAMQVKKAQEQLDVTEDEAARIKDQRTSETAQRAQQWAMNFGPDVDPLWVNDTTVTPGKTYRYRIRVQAVNNYAALPVYLKNAQDASKVLMPSEWSEWSDAITVRPAKELFVTAVEDDSSAKVEVYEWADGSWKQPKSDSKATVTVGQALSFGAGKNKISYDGIIMSADLRRPFRAREERGGVVSYKDGADPKEMRSITLVNSRGEAEEHVVGLDRNAANQFRREKAEEEKFYREHTTPPKLTRADVISASAAGAAGAGADQPGANPGAGAAPAPPGQGAGAPPGGQ